MDAQTSQSVLEIRKWSKKNLPEESAWFLDRLKEFNLGISIDGDFVDPQTRCMIRENHLRCILRRDYIESGRNGLNGKSLNTIIDIFINSLKRATKMIHEDDTKRHLMHEIIYSDETL